MLLVSSVNFNSKFNDYVTGKKQPSAIKLHPQPLKDEVSFAGIGAGITDELATFFEKFQHIFGEMEKWQIKKCHDCYRMIPKNADELSFSQKRDMIWEYGKSMTNQYYEIINNIPDTREETIVSFLTNLLKHKKEDYPFRVSLSDNDEIILRPHDELIAGAKNDHSAGYDDLARNGALYDFLSANGLNDFGNTFRYGSNSYLIHTILGDTVSNAQRVVGLSAERLIPIN